jgi:RNase P/RNase MRP subunit POP5
MRLVVLVELEKSAVRMAAIGSEVTIAPRGLSGEAKKCDGFFLERLAQRHSAGMVNG